jgi:trehalose/maltose hydrolase-like predicted phosphorylase
MLKQPSGESAQAASVAPSPIRHVLQHRFRALVFDWDGTAIANRQEDARPLARVVQRLLRAHVWIVVVTGTNFGNVDRQFCQLIAPRYRHHLIVCANRGSEVYGFEPDGTAVRRWLRVATPEEERALTAIAEAVRDALVARTGLDIRIVYDRLNRRKIDLIPLPEWADPPKDRIGDLLAAVEARLRGAGLAGGLREAVALTEAMARVHGLPDARITSDVKHIEVGLTDKSDSLAWIREHLLAAEGIAPRDVLVAGDEFGPIAGFPGSDDLLRQGIPGAVVVSVGPEPNGVPEGVLHLGGGPAQFRRLLAAQARLHRAARAVPDRARLTDVAHLEASDLGEWASQVLTPPADPTWRFLERRRQPALEHETESRLAIGNGFLGVRASLEQPTAASRPRTFIAGLFDDIDFLGEGPGLVPGPDWLRLQITLDAERLSLEGARTLAFARILDWHRGLLLVDWQRRDAAGRTVRLRTLRFASHANRALAGQLAQLQVEHAMPATLEAWVEPPTVGLVALRAEPDLAVWRTTRRPYRLALASHVGLHLDSRPLPGDCASRPGRCAWRWTAVPDEAATFTRLIAVARGDDTRDPARAAQTALRRARRAGFRRVFAAHVQAWQQRWAETDVQVGGDDAAQCALRFALYHLISAANPEDEHVSIGARALTGDGYRGHVFWDTEVFLLPFYTFTWPAAARALLMYRYHTLPAARAKARRLGYRGALYAWESADTGEETTPEEVLSPTGEVIRIRCGTDEQHISADIAYAVWQYWLATGDRTFLLRAGAEILLETARFWASRAQREADGRYHIRGVIGPDEYHEGVDDNAFTNVMAQWNLERGLEVAALLRRRWPDRWAALAATLQLDDAELAQWREVAAGLVTGFDPATGLIEQFAGYFHLEPIDLAAYATRTVPMDVILGRERTSRSQVIKQADVVMLLALLPDRFPRAVQETNFAYYEPRCGHGSSLSPPVHALVAARLGRRDLALRYFRQTAAIDLADSMGNAALGIHIGALGGLWQATVLGFGGLSLRPDGLHFDPHLPEPWDRLSFPVQWHQRLVRVQLQREPAQVTITLERGQPMRCSVGGRARQLRRGDVWTCRWDANAGDWQEVA